MARKAFEPTDEQRHVATVMSRYGARQEDIATEVGLRSPKTVRKHFRGELDHGRIEAKIRVGRALLGLATDGKHVGATIYLHIQQQRQRSRPVPASSPAAIPDFVVACDKEAA